MEYRVFNFSSGPANLPLPVLQEAQRDLLSLPGVGMSVLEISHRSKTFGEILEKAEHNLRTLLKVPDNYRILFLQGGARLQFVMAPMNLLQGPDKSADYIVTGSWGKKAAPEAAKLGKVRVVWKGEADNYSRLPRAEEYELDPQAAYVHFTSNETIEGVQFAQEPDSGNVPLVCDASSDILSKPIDISRYGLIYAGAQKNAGPAGVTLVLIREDLLAVAQDLPQMLCYRDHVEAGSMLNTPPCFAIYIVKLVTDWLLGEIGGLDKMAQINREKAQLLYEAIDQSGGFYRGHAQPESRSTMNVTWRLPSKELEEQFLAEAKAAGLCELKGHRSVGGLRAALYNAMSREGVQKLRDFMKEFKDRVEKK